MTADYVVLDSVTHLKAEHRGKVALCASHGGSYAGSYAATAGVAGLILNDAGIGREMAGIAGIVMLSVLGVPGATVSHLTARIGDGRHGVANGRLSFVNEVASGMGLRTGMTAVEALERMCERRLPPSPQPSPMAETRFEVALNDGPGSSAEAIIVMDSISLVKPEDAGRIVIAASHGGLLAGDPASAVKYDVYAVVTNDADKGIDNAGVSRLPALDVRGIAGACVSAFSSRIGDGRSQWEDGYISVVNDVAHRRGGRVGQSCRQFAAAMAAAKQRPT